MKNEILRVITSSILVSFIAITGAYAIEQKSITISKATMDISGDGKEETNDLKGELCGKTVPNPLEVESQFINGYKAKFTILQTGKSYWFDLQDRKDYYKKLGLYHNGKLNEPTELTVNPFSTLKPALVKEHEMGLIGLQRVTGITKADTIAYIQSSWLYKGEGWKLIKADVLNDVSNE